MTLYHVAPHWNGEELKALADQLGECDAIEKFMEKWNTDDSSFAQDQVTKIYFYQTLAEAQNHQDEYGGEILAIDDTYLTTYTDEIEGYTATYYPVAACFITRI